MGRPRRAVALTAFAACAALTRAAGADDCALRPNAIVADLGMHVINAGFQRTLGCHVVAQGSVGLYVPWTVNTNALGLAGGDRDPPGDVAGAVLRGRAFFFPWGAAPTGLWVSPFAQGGPVWGTRGGVSRVGPALAAGLSLGGTFAVGARVLIALGLGAQYHVVTFEGDASPPGFARFSPTVDINVSFRL